MPLRRQAWRTVLGTAGGFGSLAVEDTPITLLPVSQTSDKKSTPYADVLTAVFLHGRRVYLPESETDNLTSKPLF